MPTIAPSPVKLINLDTPNSIWEELRYENEIQYFWLGRQPYKQIWDLQLDHDIVLSLPLMLRHTMLLSIHLYFRQSLL